MIVKMRTGVMKDGRIVANEMHALSDTGAFGNHALTVNGNTGHKAMSLYPANKGADGQSHIRFVSEVVYTNKPTSGALSRLRCAPGPLPCRMPHGTHRPRNRADPLQFRLTNVVRAGEEHPMSKVFSEGREARGELIRTNAIVECARLGAEWIGWEWGQGTRDWESGTCLPGHLFLVYLRWPRRRPRHARHRHPQPGHGRGEHQDERRRQLQPAGGATDLGTGSDTVLTQMAVEVLGCPPDDFITYSSDTDFTPFDVGAYASSTTYIWARRWWSAARKVAEQIKAVAGQILDVPAEEIMLAERQAWADDGRSVTLRRDRAAQSAQDRSAPDYGRRLLRQPRQPAAVRRAVRGRDRGHRDRSGDGEQAGDGAGLRHDRQPGRRRGSDRGRHDPGAGLCRVRGDAVRRDAADW